VNPALKGIAVVMSVIVLVLFVGGFSWVLVHYRQPSDNEAVTYIWTGVSVLVGGIVAVAFGQPEPRQTLLRQITPDKLIVAYAWAYLAVGLVAIGAWVLFSEAAPLLIRNAATTFLGLALPIVSSFLRPGNP